MPTQNINSYYYPNNLLSLSNNRYFDLTLPSDEVSYDEEVVFSNQLIAEDDGNRLPINIDLSYSGSSPQLIIEYGDFYRETR
jgi:hypothetical protein